MDLDKEEIEVLATNTEAITVQEAMEETKDQGMVSNNALGPEATTDLEEKVLGKEEMQTLEVEQSRHLENKVLAKEVIGVEKAMDII